MLRLFIFFSLLTTLGAKEFQITSIAAKVNGHAITKKEVEGLLAPRREILQARYPRRGDVYQRRLKDSHDKILEQLINNELLLSEVEGKAEIPDHIVEKEISRIVRENYDGDENKFTDFLRENGLTRRSFKEQQREQILVQAYRSQQFGDIAPPSDAEIKAKYQKSKIQMRDRTKDTINFQKIFLVARDRLDPNINPESQLALADKLMAELKNGADFTELAKKYSDGAFAKEGGLREDAKRTDFTMSFGDALFEESEAGDLVGPLKDPAGYTIVKILKINYGPSPPLSDEEVYERMEKEVNIEKRTEKYNAWIKSLKDHAMIYITPT